ncbi:MAG: hypothetical protein V4699_01895 [Patescibacteria group bacterium]
MQKRNFILLIIVLVITTISILVFLSFRKGTTPAEDTTPGTNFFSQFNPFGTKPVPPAVTPPVDVSGYVPPVGTEASTAKLMKVSSMPIAGFAVFLKERLKEVPVITSTPEATGTTTTTPVVTKTTKPTPPPTEFMPALRYVDRVTGNIYQTFADKIEERKFSTTIIPKVYEAYFGNRGESVVMRYLKTDDKTIETFVGTLPKELLGGDNTGDNEVKGSFLPNNVRDISLSPDTLKIFYLFDNGNDLGDSIIGTTLNFSNNKKVQIFNSPFTEWLSQWGSSNTITLTTKPSARALGYMYMFDSAGKNLGKVLGGINGLTTLAAPSGKLVLYGDNNLSLSIYHTDTRNSDILVIKTLPEKCVWGRVSDVVYCAVPKSITAGEYPDTWYQGEMFFNDQIWKIDIKTGNATLVVDPAEAIGGEDVDGIKLALDEGGNYLFFVNKKDSFLWKLGLK